MQSTNPFLALSRNYVPPISPLPTPPLPLINERALIRPRSPSPLDLDNRNIAISIDCGQSNLAILVFDIILRKVLVMRLVSYSPGVNAMSPSDVCGFISELFHRDVFPHYPHQTISLVLIERQIAFMRSTFPKGIKPAVMIQRLNAMQGNAVACIKNCITETALHGFFTGNRIPTEAMANNLGAEFARSVLIRPNGNTREDKKKAVVALLFTAINGESVITFSTGAVVSFRNCLKKDDLADAYAQLVAWYCGSTNKLFNYLS
jgi:hypothetical protein